MTGDEKGALVAFERALQREPGHPRAAAGAARAALSLGRPELAYSMAQLALEGLPGDAEVTRIQRAAGSRLRLLDGFSGLPPMVGPGGAVPGNR
jgi:Flp pilus assembly protein TadD